MKIKKLLLALLCLATLSARASYVVFDLKCENLVAPLGINNTHPHFSWKLKSTQNNITQQAFEIQIGTDSARLSNGYADLWQSRKVNSSRSVMVNYGGRKLTSRMLCYWRVRSWNNYGQKSAWSHITRFSVGLLEPEAFMASYIGMPQDIHGVKSPLIRRKLMLNAHQKTFIHVNSLGYHELYINGLKVGKAVLSPCVSQLTKRSLIVTYDITSFVRPGSNDIVLWLGQGWYKKTTYNAIYDGPLVKAEIDCFDGRSWNHVMGTDRSWMASNSGYHDTGTWNALNFGGECVDGNIVPENMNTETLDHRVWTPVSVIDVPQMVATPQMCEPNVILQKSAAVNVQRTDDGSWLIDLGRDLTGWMELNFRGLMRNSIVRMDYSDHLDDNGTFKSQGESDEYVAAGRTTECFVNKFNHHGFRYVKVSGAQSDLKANDVIAYQISGGYSEASTFECSDSDLNQIHDMIKNTMRCLTFSGYMVDCPHLERTGYGGDGNSSTMTLQTMMNVPSVFYNWLQAWGDVIDADGSLPYVAPAGGGGGGPYWSSFIVKAPWRTYVNYADDRTMTKNYQLMKQWIGYVECNMHNGLLQRWPDTANRMWYLGDWLAPEGVDVGGESVDLVSNCVVSDCLQNLASMAMIMGKEKDAHEFLDKKKRLNHTIHQKFYHEESCTYGTGSPLDMSYAMLTGVVPANIYNKVASRLMADSYGKYKAHIAGGLMGVPVFTTWAIQNKATQLIYDILKKRDYPSYLYMIDHGATTTWEYWNGDRSHIHNCYNGIGTWFYQALGGLMPDEKAPGYSHVTISPQIPKGITYTKISKETPYGIIKVKWSCSNGVVNLHVNLPVGDTATIDMPGLKGEYGSGNHSLIYFNK